MQWLMRLVRRDRLEQELDAEVRFHVEEETRRLTRQGVPSDEARRRALAAFGGLEPMKEYTRDARRTGWVDDLIKDVRYAGRMMRRSPGFTLAAILSLAIGIGANAAIFSITDALIFRSLPVERPQELSFLNRAGFESQNLRFSHPMYLKMREAVPEAGLAAMSSNARMQATIDGQAELIFGQLVSGNWFDVAGVKAARGRVLNDGDDRQSGESLVAVLSYRFWSQRFAADPRVLGSTLRLNGVTLTVVGIAAPGFTGLSVGDRTDVWMPVTLQHELRYAGNASVNDADSRKPWLPQDGIEWLTVVTRVPTSANRAGVQARLAAVKRQDLEARVSQIDSAERRAYLLREHVELIPGGRGLSDLRRDFTAPLRLLMATVAIVLLIGCANLASLLLARGSARSRELALRLSLGARRERIVRQLLTESVTLAGVGGLVGLAVAKWGSAALMRLASASATTIPLDIALNWRIVVFTIAASLLTGLAFGLVPALRLSRTNLVDTMKSGGRVASVERAGALPIGKTLVVAQVALSLTLLAGAILFLQTFRNLLKVETGYERDRIFSARFDPRLAQISPDQLPGLYDRLIEQARRVPGAQMATLAMAGTVTGSQRVSSFIVEGQPRRFNREADAREEYVGSQYFQLMGMPIVRGRDFGDQDTAKSPHVIILNEAMVRKFFGDVDPVGKKMGYDTPADLEVVGIVRDARIDGLREPAPPLMYHLLRQDPDEFARNLYVRAIGPADGVKTALARAIVTAEPNLAVREVVTLAELTERTVVNERLISRLTAVFGLLAVFVACLGLYATVSYSVTRRTNEIGVRMALGAAPSQVRRLVLRETMWLVITGSVAGLVLGVTVLGYVGTLLYGLSPRDPATLAGSAGVLLVLGLIAGLVPAWRASRVDPLKALRAE
jgi:predicted permease